MWRVHKIGLKSEEEIAALKEDGAGFGVASCDACYTRHLFSAEEARQPQGTFHASPDYALWYGWSEMVRDLREIKEKAAELRGGG